VFRTPAGHFEFIRLPTGPKFEPASFQSAMNSVLAAMKDLRSFCCMDDVIISAESLESHNQRLRELFQRLRESSLETGWFKCDFMRAEFRFLGHCFSDKVLLPDPKKRQR
jgi:hypothetical protein